MIAGTALFYLHIWVVSGEFQIQNKYIAQCQVFVQTQTRSLPKQPTILIWLYIWCKDAGFNIIRKINVTKTIGLIE